MIALLAPGQGSQTPGMLEPWLELDGARQRLTEWSEITGVDLLELGTRGTTEEIKDTAITQPLIVAMTLLAAGELRQRVDLPSETPMAGHSVGELAAASMAGALSANDAVALAAVRGREMADACALEPTGMSAIMGGDVDEVMAKLSELSLDPANRNGGGQVVAAGRRPALEQLAAEPPRGARVRPLAVAGAFHTRFMAPARDAMAKRADEIRAETPVHPLLSNADGTVMTTAADVVHRLVEQVTLPVRWDSCMATLAAKGVDTVIEFPPAGTLVGLAKREMKNTQTLAVKTPSDLDKVVELLTDTARSHT